MPSFIFTQTQLDLTEENFTNLLPEYLRKKSRIYFTPIHIAQTATSWLTEDGRKNILDIGAGCGKFCITGARHSDSNFNGIEYRPSLAKLANDLIKRFEIKNAKVKEGNILDIDFSNYDAFYMYNPFYENLVFYGSSLNTEVTLGVTLYDYFYRHTEQQLHNTKSGTRLVTYHGNNFEVPGSFKKIKESTDSSLKLWIKK